MNDDSPRCTHCRALLWDTELAAGRWACYRCEGRASEQLHAIRAQFKRLNTTDALAKVSAGPDGGRSGSREAPAPLRLAILNQTGPGGVVTQLQSGIEDSWRKALGWQMIPNRAHGDIDGAATFLINNLPWACERYADIADDLDAIGRIHSTLKSLDTGEPGKKRIIVRCTTNDCDGRLTVTLWAAHATCPTCRTDYDKPAIGALIHDHYEPERSAA